MARDASLALAKAEAICLTRQVKLTPQRRLILSALLEAERPLGAYDLINQVKNEKNRAPAPIVMYRALDFLLEQGFIHRLESLNAFLACPHLHGTHERVIFFICRLCHKVDELTSDVLADTLDHLAKTRGFRVEKKVMECAGLCATCQQETAP